MNARRSSGRIAWPDRSALPSVVGVAWWWTTALAVALALTAALVDITSAGSPGVFYSVAYFIGCVAAAIFSARRELFPAAIQAPLIMAIVVPMVVVCSGDHSRHGITKTEVFAAILPLVSHFPLMAIVSGMCLLLVLVRVFVLEPRPRKH